MDAIESLIQMSSHKKGFYEELTKIIFQLSSNTDVICSSESIKLSLPTAGNAGAATTFPI